MKKKRREEKIRKKTVTHEHLTHRRHEKKKIIKSNDGCEEIKTKSESPMMTWDLSCSTTAVKHPSKPP